MNARSYFTQNTPITFAEPNFAKQADHQCDVSDNWIDEVDPENAQGAEVIAYFSNHDGILSLTGICIADDLATTWEDRAGALKSLTPETVRRIEDMEADALSEVAA